MACRGGQLACSRVCGHYAVRPHGGLPELREALARELWSRNDIDATADEVVVPRGASGALFASLLLLSAEARLSIVSDEVYEDFVFDGAHRSPAAVLPTDLKSRLWSVFSFSKS